MSSPLSHVHGRTYFGERRARPLIEYLNSRKRKPGVIEKLLQADRKLASGTVKSFEGVEEIQRLLRRTKVVARLQPVLATSMFHPWSRRHSWRVNLYPEPLVAVILLAATGLLDRVRQCEKCRKFFYARFEHQRFDSAKCQQQMFRSSPEWKAKKREYMKELRHRKKLKGGK